MWKQPNNEENLKVDFVSGLYPPGRMSDVSNSEFRRNGPTEKGISDHVNRKDTSINPGFLGTATIHPFFIRNNEKGKKQKSGNC